MAVTSAADLMQVLQDVNSKLQGALDALNREPVKALLHKSLHNGVHLPDKKLSASAADAVDLLAKIEHLLEPAHLVLADHFLGG